MANEYGVTAAQDGVDVRKASDYQKTLDSRWPYLESVIDIEKTTTFSATGTWVPIAEHNLGFLPGFFHRTLALDNATEFDDAIIVADKRYVYALVTDTSWVLHSHIVVFNLDVTKEFTAPLERTTGSDRSGESTQGFKILKDSKDINSDEISHYSVNTKSKSMSVYKTGVGTAEGPDFELVIRHQIGYPPTFLTAQVYEPAFFGIYGLPSDQAIAPLGHSYGKMRADSVDVVVTGVQASLEGDFAYVIMKDPIEVAE